MRLGIAEILEQASKLTKKDEKIERLREKITYLNWLIACINHGCTKQDNKNSILR